MENIQQKQFECMLGFHKYTIPDKHNPYIKICKHCKKFGYCKNFGGLETWTEYDNKGNVIYYKDSTGYEYWREYDNRGNVIHFKNSDGDEEWLDNNDEWVNKKPKNWKYENLAMFKNVIKIEYATKF